MTKKNEKLVRKIIKEEYISAPTFIIEHIFPNFDQELCEDDSFVDEIADIISEEHYQVYRPLS